MLLRWRCPRLYRSPPPGHLRVSLGFLASCWLLRVWLREEIAADAPRREDAPPTPPAPAAVVVVPGLAFGLDVGLGAVVGFGAREP